jgi:hypothetical protein
MTAANPGTLEITPDQVLAGQGIDPASASPRLPGLRAVAERVLADCRNLLEPRVASRRLPVDGFEAGAVRFDGAVRIEDAGIAERLCGASEAVFVVCTVGEPISRRAAAVMPHDPLSALAIEGLACAGVDALAAAVCDAERHRAALIGARVTAPLSPGMEDWPLDVGQRAIFGVVDATAIGVRLSESWQMYPTKSASFVLGVGTDVRPDDGGNCARCGARGHCAWRRRETEGGRRQTP